VPQTDILIIGSGVAGLAAASKIISKSVTILTKKDARQSNSMLAQGGIAAAMSPGDHWQEHLEDTLVAGCNLNDENAVRMMVQSGPVFLKEWMTKGFPVDRDGFNKIRLGKEGAHRKRRVLHAGGDQTGKIFTETMLKNLAPNVNILENLMAVDLIVEDGECLGAMVKDETGKNIPYFAGTTILATGGIGGLYEANSNNATISGDGIAMAYRAGCQLENLEFVQFHPTLLFTDNQGRGLISEAVRGEGAILVNENGVKIMEGVHPMKDLAPRDVVARALFSHILNGESIFLDISMIDGFEDRFPAITKLCQEFGVDLKSQRIPVAPGAHFHMGGIKTDTASQTNIKHLYAVGEVACQGVHGANRLASNSLLEGLVFGSRLGAYLENKIIDRPAIHEIPTTEAQIADLLNPQEIKHLMTEKVGIVRTGEQLLEAIHWFERYLNEDVDATALSREQLQVWNMLTAGWLIAKAALDRKESIGAHFMEDSL